MLTLDGYNWRGGRVSQTNTVEAEAITDFKNTSIKMSCLAARDTKVCLMQSWWNLLRNFGSPNEVLTLIFIKN